MCLEKYRQLCSFSLCYMYSLPNLKENSFSLQDPTGVPINSAGNQDSVNDIEDLGSQKRPRSSPNVPISTKRRKIDGKRNADSEFHEDDLIKHWKIVLGDPPIQGTTKV